MQPDYAWGQNSGALWYALYTKHQHEKSSVRLLDNKGFETMLPLYSSTHRWKDRTKVVSLPLFPCYIFIKTDLTRRVDMLSTPGVYSVVTTGGAPAPIPLDEIEAIRRAIDCGAEVEPHPVLACGEEVKVVAGSLTGIRGKLVRKKNANRLVVAIEMLGKAAAVEIDLCNVKPAN
jgi:transcription antitermination factor NusG